MVVFLFIEQLAISQTCMVQSVKHHLTTTNIATHNSLEYTPEQTFLPNYEDIN